MHVSTTTCYIHHKRGVAEVWHMAHFCVSYGRCCWKPPSPFSNVHLRNTTKILQHKFFILKLLFIFTLSLLKVSFTQTMSLSCIFVFAPSFIHMDLSIMSPSTSLTFSGVLVLFLIIYPLSQLIESHFALSSAQCQLRHHHVNSLHFLNALCFLKLP